MSSISQRQTLRLQQKLSPQQLQTVKMLELPTTILEQCIKQEIEENPVLEETIPADPAIEEGHTNDSTVDDYLRRTEEGSSYKYYANNFSRGETKFISAIAGGATLQESLMSQLSYRDLDERQMIMARFIVGSIDSNGYLHREPESVSDDIAFSTGLEVNIQELEYVLSVVQELEPAGIGARSLQECLLLQLTAQREDTPAKSLAVKIIRDYFDEFTRRRYEHLMLRLDIEEEEFRDAIEEITRLNPKPGNIFADHGDEGTQHIIPDFILDYSNGKFELALNNSHIPEIKISRRYLEMAKQFAGDTSPEAIETLRFVQNKIESANRFISAIKQRHETLQRTMEAILDYQRDYFADGDIQKIRPMILKDIAERVNLDVSTISRVVNSKYVQTPFGIVHLKSLFSEAMIREDGEEVSSLEVKNLLLHCVEQEDKRNPLTDEQLMTLLQEKGYQIARRTVAKYREVLGIPVARLRREI